MTNLPYISPDLISKYQGHVASTGAPATAKRRVSSLKKFFDWAHKEGHVAQNPFAGPVPEDTKKITSKRVSNSIKISLVLGGCVGMAVLTFLLVRRLGTQIPFRLAPALEPTSNIQVGTPRPTAVGETQTTTLEPITSLSPWTLYSKFKFSDESGEPVQTVQSITFSIYSTKEGGSPLWTSTAQEVVPDSEGSVRVILKDAPTNLYFENEALFLEANLPQGVVSERISISTASGQDQTALVGDDGNLFLAGESPKVVAETGNLLIEGQTVTIASATASDGDIEINPDGSGITHFLFEGTGQNFLNAQAPNLTKGSLYYGIVANNSTGYDLIRLQNGSKATTRFAVDAGGNTTATGNLAIGGGIFTSNLERLTSAGALTNITGYSQGSGNFSIIQNGGETATITKKDSALSDLLTLTLDERGKGNSGYSALTLKRYDGATEAYALFVDEGNARFDGQLQLGRFTSNPNTIGEGSMIFNTTDDSVYFYNGSSWVSVGTASTVPFSGITSGTNTTAAMVVGSGASLTYSGTGTINASTLNSIVDTQFLRSDTSDSFTSGTLTTDAGTTLDVNGNLSVADTNIAFDGATTTFTTTGDLTLAIGGGDLVLSDTQSINVGGSGSDVAYNVIGDSVAGASVNVDSDDDLYIEGNLEVDGTIYGTVSGSAGSVAWDDLTAPTADLTLSMAAFNTTFNWDPGADAAETNFILTTQGEDTVASGDEDQVLLSLSQTSNGVDVDEAADALLTLANNDADDPVNSAIRFDAGAAGTDFTYGINFDAASIGTAEIVLQNAETIDNVLDGTVLITSPTTSLSGDLTVTGNDITFGNGEAISNAVDGTITLTAPTTSLSGDLAINGGNITTAVTADSTLTVTGTLTANGAFDANGDVTIADTNVVFDGATTTFTTTGDLTVDSGGGQVVFSDTDTLNVGGLTNVAYNTFANSGEAPDEAAISSDNDLYIGGDLEVDGTIYGNVSGSAGSVTWNDITNPDGDLSLSMAAYNTTFSWDPGADTAETNFALAIDGEDTTGTGDQDQVLISLSQSNNGVDVDEAADALLTLSNADADDPVENAIRFDAGGAGVDFLDGIDFSAANLNREIVLENGEAIIGQVADTITFEDDDGTDYATLTATALTVTGDLAITGGNITTAVTADSTLTVTGTLTANGTFDANSDVTIADTNVVFDGATTTFTTTGDLTIDSGGGQVLFADTDTLNIGGLVDVAYNALANAGEAPEEAAIATDNDLYIGGDLEVDGTIYGTAITATALAWDDLTSPTADLTLTMAAYNTTFNWDPGPDAAETNFSLTTQGEDTTGTGDQDQVLLALSQTANGVDVDEAADALLTLTNSDADDPVNDAIRFDAGGAGVDFLDGIDFSLANLNREIVLENGEAIIGQAADTITFEDDDGTDYATLTATALTVTGDLAITGGNITTAVTADSTLTVTGTLTANGTFDANSDVTVADTNVVFDGATTTFTTTGDLTINSGGGQVLFADTDTLNIGGLVDVAYNALANAGEAPEEAAISSDNDLYIGGDLEVDGTIYGTAITASAVAWDDITSPTDNLTLTMAAYNTTFNWDPGPDAAETNFALTTQGEDTTGTGDQDQVLLSLSQTANGVDVDEAADALLTFANNDADDPVNDAIRFDAGGAGVDFADGIDFSLANLNREIVLENGEAIIGQSADTITFEDDDGTDYATLTATALTVTGDLAITGGNITTAVTADSTLTVTGTLTANGALDANGQVDLGDAGDTVTITSSDWTINATGDMTGIGAVGMDGDLTITQATPTISLVDNTAASDDYTINAEANAFTIVNSTDGRTELTFAGDGGITLGSATATTINLTTDSTGNAEVVLPDDSIGPNEVFTTGQTDEYCLTYEATGTTWEWQTCGSGGSPAWSALTNPTDNLTLTMAAFNTTFNWDSGPDAAETNFSLTTQGEDTVAGGDEDQVLLALSQTANGVDVDEAADALLTFANADADDPVNDAIRFDAGGAGVDFADGIDFSLANLNREIVLENGEAIIGQSADTITFEDDDGTDYATLTATALTVTGDLAITGGNITTAVTADSTLTVTGTLTANGTLDSNGDLTIADTNIAFDGATTTFTTTGDLTINSGGGQVLFADADTLNIGGLVNVAYNALANAGEAPEEAAIATDNDLYIGGDLEVDGTIYGATVVASAVAWDDITSPTADLTLTMAANNTVFNWDPGPNAAETNFTLSTQGEDSTGGGDEDQVLLALSQTANGVDVDEAADALLTFANNDADDPVNDGIRFDAGGAGVDFADGIDFSLANLNREIVLENGEAIIGQVADTITFEDDDGTDYATLTATALTLTGDLTVSGGNINSGDIAFVVGDATTDSITLTTDGTGNAEVVLPNDSIGPNEVFTTGQTDEYCLTYEATGTTWEWQTCGGGGAWNDLTNPDGDLTLTMAAFNTTFNWDPGPDAAETNFSLTTQGEDTTGTGDQDQVLLALSQTANGVDVDQAADALLTLANADADDPVVNAIRFDAGGAGTDFTYGINFDAASIGTAELLLSNAATIANTVDGTLVLTEPTIQLAASTAIDIDSPSINLATQATDIELADGTASALTISEGANNYLAITTSNGTETLQLGNAATNPAYSFLGTGAVTIAGSADGTDALILTLGDILVSDGDVDISGGDFNVTLDAGDGVNIAKGAAPTVDVVSIDGGTSATDGVDTLQLTFTADDASGNLIDLSPTFTDNDAGNSAETWNVIEIDALTVTQNDSGGAITGTVRGLNIGNLTESATGDDAITSAGINIGTGWDYGINTQSPVLIDKDTVDAIADVLTLDIGTLTDGVDGVNLNLNVTGDTANDADTFTGITIDAANNATDQVTDDNIYGLNIGNLGGTAKDGSELAIRVGTGWDDILNYNGTTLIDGDGTISASTVGGFTSGSVAFAGGTGLLSQDNTNFFWDDGANELGIGNNNPTTQFHLGASAETHALSTGDALISSDLELDGILYLDGGIIADVAGTSAITLSATPTTTPDNLTNASWKVNNTANVGMAALLVDQQKAGELFTASAAGTTRFLIANNGTTTITTTNDAATASLIINDSTGTGTGKINVGTVDPIYTVGDGKYATYMAGMVGVKEEVTGNIQTNEYIPGIGYRKVIDFKTEPIGNDLWLFSKTTDLKDNIDKLVVLLSPEGNNRAWYRVDDANYTLSIYTTKPTNVSFRLTAPRFDYALWTNFNHDEGVDGFILADEELNGSGEIDIPEEDSIVNYEIGKVETDTGTLYELKDLAGNVINEFAKVSDFLVANITAGILRADSVVTNYLQVDTISPLADSSDVKVQIGNRDEALGTSGFGKLIVENTEGAEVASIDTAGNATFSGTLEADSVKTNDITAGKIYADEIVARNGYFGETQTESAEGITREQIEQILSEVEESQTLLTETANWSVNTATESGVIDEIAVANLFVTNQAAINLLSVSETITTGADLVISSIDGVNSINSLSSPLQLQSLALAPVEIMAGKVRIETNGDVYIEGNVFIAGNLEAKHATFQGLSLQGEDGNQTASIDASGSAEFNKLTTDQLIIAGAEAATPSAVINGEIQTNATVGSAVVAAGVTEITIRNPKITDYTLVYITPTSPTENKTLYVKAKAAGYFTVGFSDPISVDATFNWWVVETQSGENNPTP